MRCRPGDDRGGPDQSGADPDGMRRAVSEGRPANCRANSTARSIATAPTRNSRRPARTGSSATACCTPSISRTAAPAIATAGSARRNGRPSTTPAARCSAASAASCRTPRPTSPHDGGVANTNIIFHAGTPAGAGGRPSADRDRAGHAQPTAAIATTTAPSPAPSPRIPRSIPSPARWCSSATTPRAR